MITPSIGRALWARRAGPVLPSGAGVPAPDIAVMENLLRALRRLDGFAAKGSYEDVKRELESLPPAARELPQVQLRVGRMLESLAHLEEALTLYEGMDRSSFAQLGRVRCLARLERIDDARALLDQIPFDPAAVKEFVEARDLVR